MTTRLLFYRILALMAVVLCCSQPARADQVILDDLIVDGSACIGFDCVNGESFGFDTIRLKENNLRIKFEDTSTTASFPQRDWTLGVNETSNGGEERFFVQDVTAGRIPFIIEGNAPNNALYVDNGGRLGLGTSNPVVELHVVDGDTPTLRLEQDGSSGFTPQTWDVAGNETNFFVRDATSGSTLPLRIRAGGAPTSSIDIANDGDVGVGIASPGTLSDGSDASLHVSRNDGDASILVTEGNGTVEQRDMLELQNNGAVQVRLVNNDSTSVWRFGMNPNDDFVINELADAGTAELRITADGDVFVNGTQLTVPDYVFESDYELMPLSKLEAYIASNRHLPNIPSAGDVERAGGVNIAKLPLQLLEKVEELTLYTLAQDKQLSANKKTIGTLQKRNTELQARLATIENLLANGDE